MASWGAPIKLCACLALMICLVGTKNAAPRAEAAVITCGRVVSALSPCIGYITRGGPVPTSCCDGLRSLNKAATTTPDVQEACRCFKTLVITTGANPTLVNALHGKCNFNSPFKYSPSLDCSKVVR